MAFAARLQRAFGVGGATNCWPSARCPPIRARRRQAARLPARDAGDSRRRTGPARRYPPTSPDRRVEITGPGRPQDDHQRARTRARACSWPTSRTPTRRSWDNNIQGHINLRDAIRRRIDYVSPEGKAYKLNEKTAVLFVRPRGWHLPEKHVLIDGAPISGGIFDFALYFFHNAKELVARGPARISTCRSSRAISRRGCGTTSS